MIGLLIGQASAGSAASSALSASRRVEGDVLNLDQRVDALELLCAGMWKILKDRHGYSTDELMQAIQEVDAADGRVDGKITRVETNCPTCGRKILARSGKKCLWCGAPLQIAGF